MRRSSLCLLASAASLAASCAVARSKERPCMRGIHLFFSRARLVHSCSLSRRSGSSETELHPVRRPKSRNLILLHDRQDTFITRPVVDALSLCLRKAAAEQPSGDHRVRGTVGAFRRTGRPKSLVDLSLYIYQDFSALSCGFAPPHSCRQDCPVALGRSTSTSEPKKL